MLWTHLPYSRKDLNVVNPREHVKALRRQWKLIAATMLLVIVFSSVLTLRLTPQYESQARLFISTSSDQSLSDAFQGSNFAIQRVSSYADLVNGGREISTRVIEQLDVGLTSAQVAEKVSATVVPESVILEITATDPDPRLAQQLAQASAEQLRERIRELETPGGTRSAPIKATISDTAKVPASRISQTSA